jgi:hypothetical protein
LHRQLLHFPYQLLRYLKLKQQLQVGLAKRALSSIPPSPRTARCVETMLKETILNNVVQAVVIVKLSSIHLRLAPKRQLILLVAALIKCPSLPTQSHA